MLFPLPIYLPLHQLTKAVRTLEKEAASHVTLKEELEKMQAWKRTKVAEIEDLMEQVYASRGLMPVAIHHPTSEKCRTCINLC